MSYYDYGRLIRSRATVWSSRRLEKKTRRKIRKGTLSVPLLNAIRPQVFQLSQSDFHAFKFYFYLRFVVTWLQRWLVSRIFIGALSDKPSKANKKSPLSTHREFIKPSWSIGNWSEEKFQSSGKVPFKVKRKFRRKQQRSRSYSSLSSDKITRRVFCKQQVIVTRRKKWPHFHFRVNEIFRVMKRAWLSRAAKKTVKGVKIIVESLTRSTFEYNFAGLCTATQLNQTYFWLTQPEKWIYTVFQWICIF